jgi:hypothetical protein
MLFKQAILAKVRAGEVSIAFRRTRPSVKAGGYLVTSIGRLAIDEVRPVREVDITEAAAQLAGEDSRAALMAALAKGKGELHRIAFHLAPGDDPRIALRTDSDLTAADWAALKRRLARMDAKAPWTDRFLELIAAHPGRRAGDLALMAGLERLEFKLRVRRLKALGLTISLKTGYRLSSRGEALRRLDAAPEPEAR